MRFHRIASPTRKLKAFAGLGAWSAFGLQSSPAPAAAPAPAPAPAPYVATTVSTSEATPVAAPVASQVYQAPTASDTGNPSVSGAATFVPASAGGAQPYMNVDPGAPGYEAAPDNGGAVVAMQGAGNEGGGLSGMDWLLILAGALALGYWVGE